MKSRPIVFNEKMVRAILDEGKTQTRRVIRAFGPSDMFLRMENDMAVFTDKILDAFAGRPNSHLMAISCPYGKIGDTLWVREKLERSTRFEFLEEIHSVREELDNPWKSGWEIETPNEPRNGMYAIKYAATATPVPYAEGAKNGWCGRALWEWRGKILPSIFMPRWASRINLKITHVTVEKLQNITTSDIVAEGILYDEGYLGSANRYRYPFIDLWDSLNKDLRYKWERNPWVWVIKFEVI